MNEEYIRSDSILREMNEIEMFEPNFPFEKKQISQGFIYRRNYKNIHDHDHFSNINKSYDRRAMIKLTDSVNKKRNDNVKDAAAVKAPYLKDALGALIKNETPKTQETKSIGCTIKRVE
jgi:hypothetical protein